MDNLTAIKAAVAAVLGALTAFWGWFGWLACLWVGLMLLDYLSGTAAACQRGEWSSAAARSGVWHKAGEVVVVLVAACADLLLGLVLDNHRAGQHRGECRPHGRTGPCLAHQAAQDWPGRRGRRRGAGGSGDGGQKRRIEKARAAQRAALRYLYSI